MKYCAVLFDFDGVIANSLGFYRHTWEQFIAKSHLPLSSSVFEKEGFFTKSLDQVCSTLKEKYNIELDKQKLIDETLSIEHTLMEAWLESDPTLVPFLEYCKKTGIKVAIGSNSGIRRIMWVLEKMNIAPYFLYDEKSAEKWYNIVSANDITHHKPDPEVWVRCSEILEISITECLVIEDGFPGLTGAKQCGAQTAYYYRFRKAEKSCTELADKSVESFSELFE